MIVPSIFAAVLPMLTYLIMIWSFDRYEREPFSKVFMNFIWGATGAIILAFIGSAILSLIASSLITDGALLKKIDTVVIAPFVEEITKGLFLALTFSGRRFDNMTDGIVYGGAIGLGFGMTENFLYFITYGTTVTDWVLIVFIRTFFSAVMHCVATATFGAFLGYAKFRNIFIKITFPMIGLGLAMFIHFSWNYTVGVSSNPLLGFVFVVFSVFVFISTFAISVLSEKKVIYRGLLEEVNQGLIPASHLLFLTSSSRKKKGWVDERIRKYYIRAATTLAFRKMQLLNSTGRRKLFYEHEIGYYRDYISQLLINNSINDKI